MGDMHEGAEHPLSSLMHRSFLMERGCLSPSDKVDVRTTLKRRYSLIITVTCSVHVRSVQQQHTTIFFERGDRH